jgi:hypothetical protein
VKKIFSPFLGGGKKNSGDLYRSVGDQNMTQRFQSDLERDRLTAINLNAITNAFANINLQSGQVDD